MTDVAGCVWGAGVSSADDWSGCYVVDPLLVDVGYAGDGSDGSAGYYCSAGVETVAGKVTYWLSVAG